MVFRWCVGAPRSGRGMLSFRVVVRAYRAPAVSPSICALNPNQHHTPPRRVVSCLHLCGPILTRVGAFVRCWCGRPQSMLLLCGKIFFPPRKSILPDFPKILRPPNRFFEPRKSYGNLPEKRFPEVFTPSKNRPKALSLSEFPEETTPSKPFPLTRKNYQIFPKNIFPKYSCSSNPPKVLSLPEFPEETTPPKALSPNPKELRKSLQEKLPKVFTPFQESPLKRYRPISSQHFSPEISPKTTAHNPQSINLINKTLNSVNRFSQVGGRPFLASPAIGYTFASASRDGAHRSGRVFTGPRSRKPLLPFSPPCRARPFSCPTTRVLIFNLKPLN